MVVIGNVNNSRMKYKLLSAHTEKTVNIGDYIQALASLQFEEIRAHWVPRHKY